MQQSRRIWTGNSSVFSKLSQKKLASSFNGFIGCTVRLVHFWTQVEKPLPRCDQQFHNLPVSQEFDKPEYAIGEVVWNVIKLSDGQILHPVTITGLYWTGIDWEYLAMLPPNHPRFKDDDHESEWMAQRQLEPMFNCLPLETKIDSI